MGIEVKCKLTVYEVDGSDKTVDTDKCSLSITSHWNSDDMVDIVLNGKPVSVSGADLIQATQNAMRTG